MLNNILSREHVPADLVFMVVNVCVAGAVLGTGFFLSLVPERPLYGTLSASAVDVHRAKRLGSLLAITSGRLVREGCDQANLPPGLSVGW